jgi:hypothetical protein
MVLSSAKQDVKANARAPYISPMHIVFGDVAAVWQDDDAVYDVPNTGVRRSVVYNHGTTLLSIH